MDDIEAYSNDGFLVCRSFVSEQQLEKLTMAVNSEINARKNMSDSRESHSNQGEINSIHNILAMPRILEVQCDAAILAKVAKLMGRDVLPFGAEIFAKPAGVGLRVPVHQDNYYWCVEPAVGLTVWIALQNSTVENGAVFYYKGSHKHGLFDHVGSGTPGSSQELGDYSILRNYEKITPELKPGDAVIHHSMVLHGSGENISNSGRCGLTLRYVPKNYSIDRLGKQRYEASLASQLRERGNRMPGYELYDQQEMKAVLEVFEEGGVLMAHGFVNRRKRFHVRELEQDMKHFFDVKNCLAVSSGTAAIKMALLATGVRAGEKVVTQAFNFIATVEAILDIGAVPVVINCDDTLNMDPKELSQILFKEKISAVIAVNMLGVTCNLDDLVNICRKANVPIIEDACESVGALYRGKYSGTICDIGVFSFDHGKMIACGEGGLILTNNDQYYKFCYEYHDHGHENNPKLPKGRDTRTIWGFNYRMTELQASIAKVQLKKLPVMLAENLKRATPLLEIKSEEIHFRTIPDGCNPTHDTVMVRAHPETLVKISNILKSHDFGTKNVPDAMEWHCAFYWDHIFDETTLKRVEKTKKSLENFIAIPVSLDRPVEHYINLAKSLDRI